MRMIWKGLFLWVVFSFPVTEAEEAGKCTELQNCFVQCVDGGKSIVECRSELVDGDPFKQYLDSIADGSRYRDIFPDPQDDPLPWYNIGGIWSPTAPELFREMQARKK